jgi:hypothetical protein
VELHLETRSHICPQHTFGYRVAKFSKLEGIDMSFVQKIAGRVKAKLKNKLPKLGEFSAPTSFKQMMIDQEMRNLLAEMRLRTPDSPILKGHKVYCQVDEDGIIAEICRRLAISNGTFVELGCGDGRENNSHALLLKGWRGVWVDGSDANMAFIASQIPMVSKTLRVQQLFIDADNIQSNVQSWATWLGQDVDLFSIDLDGNDSTILAKVIEVIKPKIVVAEYNGKFHPPIKVGVKYNPGHYWTQDDYYGSSLQTFVDLLEGYKLVCCNLSGVNAFFVRKDLAKKFTSYSVEELFLPPRNYLAHKLAGGPPSLRYLANVLAQQEEVTRS